MSSTALGDRDLWKPGKFYPVEGDKENFLAISADLMKNTEEVSRGEGGLGGFFSTTTPPRIFWGSQNCSKCPQVPGESLPVMLKSGEGNSDTEVTGELGLGLFSREKK